MARSRRFLAPQARSGDGKGYLGRPDRPYPPVADEAETAARIAEARAICDEPEAIGPAIVDAYAELGRTFDELRRKAQIEQARIARTLLTVEARIRDAQRRAKIQRMDVTSELWLIRKMLIRGNETAALVRVERLEARLDGVLD